MTQSEFTDPVQAWVDAGWFKQDGGLQQIDWNDMRTVTRRVQQVEKARQHYGLHLGNGPFTVNEAKQFAITLDEGLPAQQLQILGNSTAAFRDLDIDPGPMFQQLAIDGNAGSLSVAGINLVHGDSVGSRRILEGREYRRTNKEQLAEWDIDDTIKANISNDLSNLSWHNGKHKEVINETILDAYVGIKKQSGDFKNFDQDAYKQAVRYATGGVFELGGQILPNPVWGMQDGVMDDWIDNVSWEYIERTSGIPKRPDAANQFFEEVNVEDFWDGIKNGEYKLAPYDQHDQYVVLTEDGFSVKSFGDTPYIIKYDASAQKKPETTWWGGEIKEKEEEQKPRVRRDRFGRVMN